MTSRNVGGYEVPTSEAGTMRANQANRQEARNQGGGGGDSCFPADAKVLTPTGWRNIIDCVAGEYVLAPSPDGLTMRRVLKQAVHLQPRPIMSVQTNNQESFRVTCSHSVMTDQGWQRVGTLKPGSRLVNIAADGTISSHTVEKVENTGELEPVYNLIIEEDFTFVVKGCTAHSFTSFRRLRMCCYRLACWLHAAVSPGKSWLIRPAEGRIAIYVD